MYQGELQIALAEEIGNPDLFVGRKKELAYFLDWTLKVKDQLSQSTAILARRKKGKTALLQRLYNILYSQNDPQIIPFYFKVEEGKITQLRFSEKFYQMLMTQYFAYKLRETGMIGRILPFDRLLLLAGEDKDLREDIQIMAELIAANNFDLAWGHARDAGHRISHLKNERIVQMIDEFQFLNEYIYRDEACTQKIELALFYQSTAESKISPQLITGSYIGWLSAIIGKMTARYRSFYLGNLTDEDALAAVYNYANLLKLEVKEEIGAYIAAICENDPFYISGVVRSSYEGKNYSSLEMIFEILNYETSYPAGEIAKVWLEYLWSAFERVNDKNSKKIVLYLAKYGSEERSREQIRKDLNLIMSDGELEQKLTKLVRADIIAYGSTNYDYKGLGDKVFEMVFRKVYEKEISNIPIHQIESEMMRKLSGAERKVSYYKGLAAEYRVINYLLFAALHEKPLKELVYNPMEELEFKKFRSVKKRTVHLDQARRIEVDIWCETETEDGFDFIVEVKDWKNGISSEEIQRFLTKKILLEEVNRKKLAYIFYSERGFTEEQIRLLKENGIMYTDWEKLNN